MMSKMNKTKSKENERTGHKCQRSIPPVPAATRIITLLTSSLSNKCPKLYNCLPRVVRDCTGYPVEEFKAHLDNFLRKVPDERPVPGYTIIYRAATNSQPDQVDLQYRDASSRCSSGSRDDL